MTEQQLPTRILYCAALAAAYQQVPIPWVEATGPERIAPGFQEANYLARESLQGNGVDLAEAPQDINEILRELAELGHATNDTLAANKARAVELSIKVADLLAKYAATPNA